MRILSFDPGHTTGVACLDAEGNLCWGMTVTSEEVGRPAFFRAVTMLAKPDAVVIEEPPHFARDSKTLTVYHSVKQWFEVAGVDVVTVNPGQWKGMSREISISGLHQQDAANMARWLRRNKNLQLPKPDGLTDEDKFTR